MERDPFSAKHQTL